ncbi:MAG: hypothetical protein CL846_04015 [Crocinitomicaceae bacterium]|nr:hypothetical protein [Crocinitomicaceae bacterium]|tara:strand:+ start:5353 stop:6171 length:819 start_codon:yes stop_codon:yes gene_type:complete
MNKSIIILISICFLAFSIPTNSIKNKLDKNDLLNLYAPLFESFKTKWDDACCDYGYVRSVDRQYYEGFKGIFLYANYARNGVVNYLKSNGESFKRSSDFYNIELYKQLSEHDIFVNHNKTVAWKKEFCRYNPAFINWAIKNLIPPKDFNIDGTSAQFVYKHYSRFFRLLTESYLYLNKNDSYSLQAQNYIKDVNDGQDGLDVLFGTYHYALEGYELPNESEVYSPFEPHMAFGFWLRRNIDGSHDEIYDGLKIIMNRFDKRWFKSINKKYKK